MVRSPLVAANPITLPQCPLCTAQPGRVKWYLVGVAPRQASVGCICGYFSWMYLWGTNTAWAAFLPQLDWEWTVWTCWSAFSFWNFKCLIQLLSVLWWWDEEEKRTQKNAKQRLHILICHCLCHINTVKQFAVSAAFYLPGLCATNQTVKAGFEFIVHIIACPL